MLLLYSRPLLQFAELLVILLSEGQSAPAVGHSVIVVVVVPSSV